MNARATSFGRRANDYDRVRPEYRADVIDIAVSRLGLGPDADVLDLGAGTGKLTRPLVERFRRVVAVEPDPGMRAVLARTTEAYLSTSPFGTLPPDEFAAAERRLRGLIVGEHTLPLHAELYWTRLR